MAGTVSGIRFFKSSQDTGVHTGELWSSTGVELATVTFTNESDGGWQTATFSSPVTITPGAIYPASYHTNAGHYSNTGNYFTTTVTSGPLTAPVAGNGVTPMAAPACSRPAPSSRPTFGSTSCSPVEWDCRPSSTAAGGNGGYAYGGSASTGLFPTNTFGAPNYYADVVFRPQLA